MRDARLVPVHGKFFHCRPLPPSRAGLLRLGAVVRHGRLFGYSEGSQRLLLADEAPEQRRELFSLARGAQVLVAVVRDIILRNHLIFPSNISQIV